MTDQKIFRPSKETWRGASFEVRCKWRESLLIKHPKFRKSLETITEKIEHAQQTGKGAGVFLMGAPGTGKSTLISYLEAVHSKLPEPYPDDRTLCPVVKLKIPRVCNQKQLMVEFLEAIGDPFPDQGSYTQLKKRVIRLFNECRVRLVLVDDLQDVPARRSTKGIEEIASCFRDLIDETSAVFLLCGTEKARIVIDGEVQLRRRTPCRLYLRYFGFEEQARKQDFKRLMVELDEWMPLAEPSCITESIVIERMFFASNGILQYLVELMDLAWPIAVKAERESVCIEDLAIAFQKLWGDVSAEINPFVITNRPHKLIGEGEPFYGWE